MELIVRLLNKKILLYCILMKDEGYKISDQFVFSL